MHSNNLHPSLCVVPSEEADVSAIAEIYGHYVLTSPATFEIVPPDATEMTRRRSDVLAHGFPHLVAKVDGVVVGYAYASPYRPRSAYRFTVEDSIYIHPAHTGKGIGRQLLAALIASCEAVGCRQMVAVIGGTQSAASIGLHEAFGFKHVGVLRSVGFKFGRWVDAVLMQRPLGTGSTKPPDQDGTNPSTEGL